jgi:diacylglycerol kinase (ATP)
MPDIGMLLSLISFKIHSHMKQAHLFHNPGAGNEEHSKDKLISMINVHGYECRYSSTDETGWEDFQPQTDFLIVAGGDGTIRKIAQHLLTLPKEKRNIPIAVLPLGTANNIAKTLGVHVDPEENIQSWEKGIIQKYDIGNIEGMKEPNVMMESFGYGIFPYLMLEMEKLSDDKKDTPEKELQSALELLYKIIQSYKPRFCKLKVDGSDHSGQFLLVEVMNIRSIGPNVNISPYANPGDEEFEVVLVPEKHKEKFAKYVMSKIKGGEETYSYHTLKGKKIKISWDGTHVHVDDQTMKIGNSDMIKITLEKNALQFLVPAIVKASQVENV